MNSSEGRSRKRTSRHASGSRPSSATSSRKVSPLLLAKKASPMLSTHPTIRHDADGSAAAAAAVHELRLPHATLDGTAEDEADLLYNVREVPTICTAESQDGGGQQRHGDAQKRRRVEKKHGKKPPARAASAAIAKPADPAVVRGELERLSSLFARVEFQLQLDKAPLQHRSTLFPRDIGTLLLWAVPSPIPLIESPKVFCIKNKSRLRDCVVVFVNGWSYDMMMCTGVGVKHPARAATEQQQDEEARGGGQKAATAAAGETEEVWNEKICNALLQPIRQNNCWARQASEGSTNGGVQYAPLFIPNMRNTLEQDIFWRNDAPRTPRDGSSSNNNRRQGQQSALDPDDDVVDVRRVNTPQEEAKGVGSALRRAKEIVSNSASPVTPHAPDTLSPTAVAASEKSTENAGSTTALSGGSNGNTNNGSKHKHGKDTEDENEVAAAAAAAREKAMKQPLWGKRKVLEQYALHLPEHRIVLEELGFTLAVPTIPVAHEEEETGSGPQASGRPTKQRRVPDAEWDQFDDPTLSATADTADDPKVFAFDCEMVLTGSQESQLARATLINVRSGELAFDMLVKPRDPVTNYLTRFSGIDEDMLRDVTATLKDCQAALKRYVDTETFVIGHSLDNDFKACKMLPTCRVLDSAWLYPHPSGLPYKNALKFLAMRYLGRRIQQGSHDSSIDALASADLVYLKMERGPTFGVRERVSVLGLMTTTTTAAPTAAPDKQKRGSTSSSSVDPSSSSGSATKAEEEQAEQAEEERVAKSANGVSIHLFDDAQVLTTIMPGNNAKRIDQASNPSGETKEDATAGAANAPSTSSHVNLGAINAIPVRHDEDATRKIIRALHKRQLQQNGESEKNGGSAQGFSFMWVQLTETRDVDVVMHLPVALAKRGTDAERATAAAGATKAKAGKEEEESEKRKEEMESEAERLVAEEEEQLRRVSVVNDRVLRIIEACPDETLVVVLAGDCSVATMTGATTTANSLGQEQQRRWVCNNQYSQAQGAAFFFIKDSTAPGPTKDSAAAPPLPLPPVGAASSGAHTAASASPSACHAQ